MTARRDLWHRVTMPRRRVVDGSGDPVPVRIALDAVPIAHEIYRRMLERGLNPKSLAAKAGVGPTYISDILKGKSQNPMLAQLRKVAEALDCELEDLTHPTVTGSQPEGSYQVHVPGILPLRPGEFTVINLWRFLSRDERDDVLAYITTVMANRARSSDLND